MIYKPEDILNRLKENEYAPIYFLYGPEVFYIDQITEFIEENVTKAVTYQFLIYFGAKKDALELANRFNVIPCVLSNDIDTRDTVVIFRKML